MPRFTFIDVKTNEETYEYMSSETKNQFLLDNPNLQETFSIGSPMICSGRGMNKPDNAFRDILKEIKKKNSQGTSRSTINTF